MRLGTFQTPWCFEASILGARVSVLENLSGLPTDHCDISHGLAAAVAPAPYYVVSRVPRSRCRGGPRDSTRTSTGRRNVRWAKASMDQNTIHPSTTSTSPYLHDIIAIRFDLCKRENGIFCYWGSIASKIRSQIRMIAVDLKGFQRWVGGMTKSQPGLPTKVSIEHYDPKYPPGHWPIRKKRCRCPYPATKTQRDPGGHPQGTRQREDDLKLQQSRFAGHGRNALRPAQTSSSHRKASSAALKSQTVNSSALAPYWEGFRRSSDGVLLISNLRLTLLRDYTEGCLRITQAGVVACACSCGLRTMAWC